MSFHLCHKIWTIRLLVLNTVGEGYYTQLFGSWIASVNLLYLVLHPVNCVTVDGRNKSTSIEITQLMVLWSLSHF